MKKFLFMLIAIVIYTIAFSQEKAEIGSNCITKVKTDEYNVRINTTAKQATTLLVNCIKARQSTQLTIGNYEITVKYSDTKYEILINGNSTGEKYSNLSDTKKIVLKELRNKLGIT